MLLLTGERMVLGCIGHPGWLASIRKAYELNRSHRLPMDCKLRALPHCLVGEMINQRLRVGSLKLTLFFGLGNLEVSRPLTNMTVQYNSMIMRTLSGYTNESTPCEQFVPNAIEHNPVSAAIGLQPTQLAPTLLNHRSRFTLASFNVRTLRQIGQQAALARSMETLDIDICCLSETRLYDSTSVSRLQSPSQAVAYRLRCSGDTIAAAAGLAGVGIALSQRAEAALLEWIPINSRLCAIRLDGSCRVNRQTDKKRCLFVVSCYAPTECSPASTKDEFYTQLHNLLRRAHGTDMVVLAGDVNARVGRLSSAEHQLGGPHGLDGCRNDNGDRLLHLCADHRLFLASVSFRHRKRHHATWRPPSATQQWTQIDHIAVSYRWRGSVQDCRSYWNTCVESDHAMVCANITMRFCGKRINRSKKLDVFKLKEPAKLELFQQKLAQELDQPVSDNLEEKWRVIQGALKQVGANVCGYSNQSVKPWISSESLRLLDQQRSSPITPTHNATRSIINRQLSQSLRQDKEAWWRKQAEDMERAWAAGDSRRLFRLIQSTGPKRVGVSEIICELDGALITNLSRRMDRWAEHFELQFNTHTSTTTASDCNPNSWPVSSNPPQLDEIRGAIATLKNGKSPGEDRLPSELLKCGGEHLLIQLASLFAEIWTRECVPTSWTKSLIVPIFKKGRRTDCANHRGISLLTIVSKILATIILRRLSSTRESTCREEQAGFRSGRGCVDQIFTLRQILEHRRVYQRPTVTVFLDIRAAFDSVDRGALWDCVLKNGVPPKFVRILQALYENNSGRVRVYNRLSSPFAISSGVRQGCPISPFLFNFVLDDIFNRTLAATTDGGVELLPGSRVFDLDYADDVALLGDDPQAIQSILDKLAIEARRFGLCFSPSKCKVLVQAWPSAPPLLTIAGEHLESVNSFTYLGSQISAVGDISSEITSRIAKARAAFSNLRHLWRRRDISLFLKGRVYCASVRAVLLYGCESWSVRVEDMQRLSVFDHRCLRSISRVWWEQRISNAEVRRRVLRDSKETELQRVISRHQLRWLGHVLRMQPHRLPRRTLLALSGLHWKKARGGQPTTWKNNMKKMTVGLSSVGSTRLPGWGPKDSEFSWLTTLADMAQDRTQWRTCCSFLQSSNF